MNNCSDRNHFKSELSSARAGFALGYGCSSSGAGFTTKESDHFQEMVS